MDVKKKRFRNDRNINASYPGLPQALGTSSCDSNREWYARASSWQGNSNVDYNDIQAENEEQAQRWGVPFEDNLPNPNGVPPNAGFSGVASRNTDDPLPNPHNWSSNPGYMGTSTASMLVGASPGTSRYRTAGGGSIPGGTASKMPNPVIGRSPIARPGSVAMPAPGDTDPRSEGTAQVMTQGNNT